MKAKPVFLTCAAVELARFFALASVAASSVSASASAPQLFRMALAPNALFAAAFLFLGLDEARYEAYRPLVLVGKAAALFSAALALPRLLGLGGASVAPDWTLLAVVGGIAAWDVASSVLLLARRRGPAPSAGEADPAPEVVEIV